MKDVTTLSPDYTPVIDSASDGAEKNNKRTQRTVVPGHLARRTAPLVRHATDPAHIALVIGVVVPRVPAPLRDGAPVFDVDFHRGLAARIPFGGWIAFVMAGRPRGRANF